MKKSKNLSPYKLLLLIIINLFIHNIIVFILSIFILFLDFNNSVIIFIILFISIIFINNINKDIINIGIVEEKRNNYYVVDKLLYKVQIFNDNLEVGDIIKTNNKDCINTDNKYLKYNIRFKYEDVDIISRFDIRYKLHKYINSFDEKSKLYISRILYNDYTNNDLVNIGYGFSFFLFIKLLAKKHHILSLLLCILFSILIKFDVKFLLIFIDLLIDKFEINKLYKLFYETLIIMFINYYLLLNYSILLPLIFIALRLFDLNNDKSNLFIIESLLFYRIEPLMIIFYKYIIFLKIFEFIITIIYLIINKLSFLYLFIMDLLVNVYNVLLFGFNGRINLILLIIYLVIIHKFKLNSFIKSLIILILIISPFNNPFFHVSFIDVGQGDATFIHTGISNLNILIDTGSEYNYSKLKKYLTKEGVLKIDYLIITHDDLDHSGNILNLTNDFLVDNIIKDGKDIIFDNIKLKYLDLNSSNNNNNDSSLVYYLNYHDVDFLFTGDISSSIENNIYNLYKISDIDVLKVSHHGSNTSTSKYFVSLMLPRFSIISTSGAYGHPSLTTISNLEDYLSHIYITKEDGTVTFYLFDFINLIFSNNKIDIFVN